MLETFAIIGIIVVSGILTFGVSFMTGLLHSDGDFVLPWVSASLIGTVGISIAALQAMGIM